MPFNILDHLEKLQPDGGSETKGEKSFLCPACGSSNFKVDLKEGKYYTFGCNCAETEQGKRQIRHALSPAQGSAEWQKPPRPAGRRQWAYTDEQGNPTVLVVRDDDGSGGRKILQRYWYQGQWQWPAIKGPKGERIERVPDAEIARLRAATVPFNHHAAMEAIATGQKVFWVEGEPCCDALNALGLCAVTSLGGSQNLDGTDWHQSYPGEQVVVCPDQDQGGLKYAEQVAAGYPGCSWLLAFPTSSRWGDLPKDKGADLADWIEAGATVEHLIESINVRFDPQALRDAKASMQETREASESYSFEDVKEVLKTRVLPIRSKTERLWELRAVAKMVQRPASDLLELMQVIRSESLGVSLDFDSVQDGLSVVNLDDLIRPEGRQADSWLIANFLRRGSAQLLVAAPKTGKSLLAYHLLRCLLLKEDFLGNTVHHPCRVLLIQAEESNEELIENLEQAGIDLRDPDIREQLTIVRQFNVLTDLQDLAIMMAERQFDVVITDSVSAICANSEHSENDAQFAGPLRNMNWLLTVKHSCAHVAIHHAAKSSEAKGVNKSRGSSAIPASFGTVLTLDRVNEDDPMDTRRWLKGGGRGSVVINWTIQLNSYDGWFDWTFEKHNGAEGDLGPLCNRILGLLAKQTQPMRAHEIYAHMDHDLPTPKGMFYRAMRMLRDTSQVTYVARSSTTSKGRPDFLYSAAGTLMVVPAAEPVQDARPALRQPAFGRATARDEDGEKVEVGKRYAIFTEAHDDFPQRLKFLQTMGNGKPAGCRYVIVAAKEIRGSEVKIDFGLGGGGTWIHGKYLSSLVPDDVKGLG